jgi:hypothetical protein
MGGDVAQPKHRPSKAQTPFTSSQYTYELYYFTFNLSSSQSDEAVP